MDTQSIVTKMKCQVSSNTTHHVLISKEISFKSYKEICSGEPKKVNLGYLLGTYNSKIENNTLMPYPQSCGDFPHTKTPEFPNSPCIYGLESTLSFDWEVLSKFFSLYNIKPNWLDCYGTYGWYDEDQGGWTGCMGKV